MQCTSSKPLPCSVQAHCAWLGNLTLILQGVRWSILWQPFFKSRAMTNKSPEALRVFNHSHAVYKLIVHAWEALLSNFLASRKSRKKKLPGLKEVRFF
jgi:hypothetical protein